MVMIYLPTNCKSVALSEAKNIYTSLKLTASLHLKIKDKNVDKKAFCMDPGWGFLLKGLHSLKLTVRP